MTSTAASLGRTTAPARTRSGGLSLRGLALTGIPLALLMSSFSRFTPWMPYAPGPWFEPWRLASFTAMLALGAIGLVLLSRAPEGADRLTRVVLGAPAVMVSLSLLVHGAMQVLGGNLPSGVGTQGQLSEAEVAFRAALFLSRTIPAVIALAALVVVAVRAEAWQAARSPAAERSPRAVRATPLAAGALVGTALLGALAVALVPTLLARQVLPLSEAARMDPAAFDMLGLLTGAIAETTTGIALLLGVALTVRATPTVRSAGWALLGLLGIALLLEGVQASVAGFVDPFSALGRTLHEILPGLQVWGFVGCAVLGAVVLLVTILGERR